MDIRIFGTIVLLLSIAFVVGIDSCNGSKTSQSEIRIEQSKRNPSIQESVPLGQIDSNEPTDHNPEPSLSPREYGRANPFVPLLRERRGGRVARKSTATASRIDKSKVTQAKAEENESEQWTTISLTAVFGDAAIFEEGGASRSVAVGDTIAGMEVLEIRNDKVLLSKGDGKHTMTLGAQFKAIAR